MLYTDIREKGIPFNGAHLFWANIPEVLVAVIELQYRYFVLNNARQVDTSTEQGSR